MLDSYKVMRAFQRHEGKALRQYARGSIISAKDAAKMDIRDKIKFPRGSPLQTLIRSGAIYRMPAEEAATKEVALDGGRPS
jgi:hypothetical protein